MGARSIGGLCRPRNGRHRPLTENRLPIWREQKQIHLAPEAMPNLIYGIKLKWKQMYTPVW
jgi:hypothetical protein